MSAWQDAQKECLYLLAHATGTHEGEYLRLPNRVYPPSIWRPLLEAGLIVQATTQDGGILSRLHPDAPEPTRPHWVPVIAPTPVDINGLTQAAKAVQDKQKPAPKKLPSPPCEMPSLWSV